MPFVYGALRSMLRVATEIYFVDVQDDGVQRIPESGPVVLACNHPNSIMDPILLGTRTSRRVQFMAKSGLFHNPVVKWIFDQAGVIPVYRQQDNPADTAKNQDSFRRAYEVLDAGGCIGIFPEGENTPTEHAVADIKTGAARLALGAEARHGFALGVRIVPVGLNFVDRDRFFSSVLVRVGEPIDVRTLREAYGRDERQTVRDLTQRLQDALRDLAVHASDDRERRLLRDVHAIYGRRLASLLEGGRPTLDALDALRATSDELHNLEDHFSALQAIRAAMHHFLTHDPAVVDEVEREVAAYNHHLHQVALKHEFLDRNPRTLSLRREVLKLTLLSTLWSLPALYGLVHNAAPYWLTKLLAERIGDEAKRAFAKLVLGGLWFGLFYASYVALAWQFDAGTLARALYLMSIPVSGFVTLRSLRQLRKYRDRMLVRVLFMTQRGMVQDLLARRERLMTKLDRLRERYVRETGQVWN